jgi:hypothetical protein
MAECDWAILCDYAFLDVNRKMCLIGAFNQIHSARVPAKHPQAALAVKLVGEAGEKVSIRLEIVRPTGGVLGKVDGEVQLGDAGTGEIQMQIVDLPLPDWGLYSFNLYLGDQLAKTLGFTVNQTAPPKPGG